MAPRGAHGGKRPVPLKTPVNLVSAAAGGRTAGDARVAARVVVLNLDGQLYVRNLSGAPCLRWNGQPVTEAKLRHGDRLQLGEIEYEVVATQCQTTNTASASAAAARAELRAAGDASPQPLRVPVALIARSEHADVRLANGAGDACAMILRLGERYWLWNLDGASESRVNSRVVTRAELTDGSTLSIGGTEFQFHTVTSSAPTSAPAPPRVAPPQNKPSAPVQKPAPAPLPPPVKKAPAPAVPPVSAAPAVAPKVQPPEKATVPVPSAGERPPVRQGGLEPPPSKPRGRDTVAGDDAESIKRWGPLAFAVAAADRPELQAGQMPSEPPPPVSPEPARSGGRTIVVVLALVVLAVLGVGGVLAWRYLHGLPLPFMK